MNKEKTYSNADVAVQADPRIKVKESENVKTIQTSQEKKKIV